MKGSVWAPVALLNGTGLPASAKLVWLLLPLISPENPATATALRDWSGLDNRTVRTALNRLRATGWLPPESTLGRPEALPARKSPEGALQATSGARQATSGALQATPGALHAAAQKTRVRVPAALLVDNRLSAGARVLYGQLQSVPDLRYREGCFTYATLSDLTGAGPNTLKRAVADLAEANWITLTQANRSSPIRFFLRNPAAERGAEEVKQARRRLKAAPYRGEAIMREYLSLLIDSREHDEDAELDFLINPFTGERMHLDRFYPGAEVGFEFNGRQHYEKTAIASWDETVRQVGLDAMKAFICRCMGITLVVVQPADLTLAAMREKVGNHLPLRDASAHDRLLQFLERFAAGYRARTPQPGEPTRAG